MKAYMNTRLHQMIRPSAPVKGSWFNFSFGRSSNISLFYWIRKFSISIDTTIFLTMLVILTLIGYGVFSMLTYIEYKQQDKFRADQYIDEVIVPYEAKIQQLQNKVSELEARSIEIIYFKKFIPTKNYIIKGGTQAQRVNFRRSH